MLADLTDPAPVLVNATFHAMEEVSEVALASGWRGRYRQLAKGPITSRWRSLHLGRSSLILHRLDSHAHVSVAPPVGCVALSIMPPPSRMLVEGTEFGSGQALVFDAEADFLVTSEARCDTLVLPALEFEASAQALFPGMSKYGETVRRVEADPSRWSALQRDLDDLLRQGSLSPEDLSRLTCRFLEMMTGETEACGGGVLLGNRSTHLVAKLAQEYIEGHYSDTIRMEDLCRHTGVALRTLQRSFSEYFQVSPSDFIKARRLEAARQSLLAGTPPRDLVTRIAFDSGFTHLGRFSVDYREHFGESPRETLARA